jgi:hypothetical protein
MREWAVGDFVSRVAEQVTSAGSGLVALVDRGGLEPLPLDGLFSMAFTRVEPSPDFVATLYRELLTAPNVALDDPVAVEVSRPDRRVIYGVAAVGSLASFAVLAALIWRNRANRIAA